MRLYWRQEEDVLSLLDPRFNASLVGASRPDARVHPKPRLLILFPAFPRHEVSPHFSDALRVSVAANFKLKRRHSASFERTSEFSVLH